MKRIKLTVFFLLILVSCNRYDHGGYTIKQDTEFGKNLILTYSDTTINHFFSDSTKNQQEGVFLNYHSNGTTDTMFIGKGTIVIESHVHNVKSDSNYIIIDQKPLDLIFGETDWEASYPHRPNWPGNTNEAEKMLKESRIHRYWIIKKGTKDIYGGYTRRDFDLMCEKLNIPQNLKFSQ